MTGLYQLIYSSIRNPSCTDAEIEDILKSCKKNNPKENITGILLHSRNRFIQYIEGTSEISKLYEKIKLDDRHFNVTLLAYSPIEKRIFPSWQMGFKDIDKLGFYTSVTEEDKIIFNNMINGGMPEVGIGVSLLKKFFEKA